MNFKTFSSKIFLSFVFLLPPLSVFAQTLEISRYWMQDRFIKAMMVAAQSQQSTQSLDQFISSVEAYKNLPIKEVPVKDLNELQKLREIYMRSEGTYQEDAALLAPLKLKNKVIFTSDSPEVQTEFEKIQTGYRNLLDKQFTFPPKAWLTQALSWIQVVNFKDVYFFDLLFENNQDSTKLIKGIKNLSQDAKLEKIKQFSDIMLQQISKIDQVAENALNSGNTNFKDPTLKKAVNIMIKSYFADMDFEQKLNLAFIVLEQPENMHPVEIFRRVGQKSDPNFQKVFQVIGRDSQFDPELAKVFISFEQDLPPMPKKYVLAELEKIKSSPNVFEVVRFDIEPVKVGTMAQVHYAQIRFTDGEVHEVAVRILKNNLVEKVQFGAKAFENVAKKLMAEDDIRQKLPTLPKILQDQKHSILNETSSSMTVKGQELGFKSYDTRAQSRHPSPFTPAQTETTIEILVPKIYGQISDQTILSEWAPGASFDQFKEKYSELARRAVETWVQKWAKTVFVDTGFVHSDPHAGNLKFTLKDNKVYVTVLDFGMTGQVREDTQLKFALFAISNFSKSDLIMARTLIDISMTSNNLTAEQFASLISNERQKMGDQELNVDFWIKFAVKNGLEFPIDFTNMARGLAASTQVLKASGSRLKIGDLIRQSFIDQPQALFKFRSLPTLISPAEIAQLTFASGHQALPKAVNAVTETLTPVVERFSGFLGGLFTKKVASQVLQCHQIFTVSP